MTVRYSTAARRDLVAIYLQGEGMFGTRQAEAYTAGLGSTLRIIAEYPLASRLRVETEPPVRIRPYKSHVIVYAVDQGGVLILRIRHGHEDWASDPLGGQAEEAGDAL